MTGTRQLINKDSAFLAKNIEDETVSYEPVTHQVVQQRFLALLDRDRDTGVAASWKEKLLEPPNPLKPARRAPLKLPVLYALWIAGLGLGGFLWFSFPR